MKRALTLLPILCILVLSCVREARIDGELIASDTPCLKIKGKMVQSYDPLTCQLGYNASLNQFRCGNDDMSDFFILTCDQTPREAGQELTVSLSWIQDANVQKREGLTLKVEKIADDGTLWLWNGKESIGAVVRILR